MFFFPQQVALLVLAAVAVAEPEADAQFYYGNPYFANAHTSLGLTAYANGAVVPTDTLSVQAAKAQHFAAKAAVAPFGYGYYGAGYLGGAHYIGKREAEAEADAQYLYAGAYPYAYANPHTSIGLTAYANGAVAPTKTLAVQQAEAQHFAAKAAAFPYGYAGLYGAAHYIGKREAEAEPEAQYLYNGVYGYPYATNYANYGFVNNYAYGAARYPFAGAYLG